MESMSNTPNNIPQGFHVPGMLAEINDILDYLEDPKDKTVEKSLETLIGETETFKRLGYLAVSIWFSNNPSIDKQQYLEILNKNMKIGYDSAPYSEKDQSAVYFDFVAQTEIAPLYDLFDALEAHADGQVRMLSIFNIQTMNANMGALIEGMKEYLQSSN